MKSYIIDTSVVVKWFDTQDEANLINARKVLDDFQKGLTRAFTVDLLLIELANVLLITKKFFPLQIKVALESLSRCRMTIFSVNTNLTAEAAILASKYQITPYDAIFVVLARQNNCQLVSADQKSHGKITDSSVVMLKDYPPI